MVKYIKNLLFWIILANVTGVIFSAYCFFYTGGFHALARTDPAAVVSSTANASKDDFLAQLLEKDRDFDQYYYLARFFIYWWLGFCFANVILSMYGFYMTTKRLEESQSK